MGVQFKGVRAVMKGALQLVYPPQCMGCGETVGETGALCPGCWNDTGFIVGICCDLCGAPLPDDGSRPDAAGARLSDAEGARCDECLRAARPWVRGRAALVYRGTGRRLVLALKHGDRLDIAAPLGDWLARTSAPLIAPDTLVVPVPLHLRRLFHRRYNQAELLARRIARAHGLPLRADLLFRTRATPPQDHRPLAERFANLEGALRVRPRELSRIAGRPVLLVDDVMASGATLTAAAGALIAQGAGPVSVAVLARAVKEA